VDTDGTASIYGDGLEDCSRFARVAPPIFAVTERPNGTLHVHNFACGPDLPTHAEDDACVDFYDATYGNDIIGPLSMMVTSEGDYLIHSDVH